MSIEADVDVILAWLPDDPTFEELEHAVDRFLQLRRTLARARAGLPYDGRTIPHEEVVASLKALLGPRP